MISNENIVNGIKSMIDVKTMEDRGVHCYYVYVHPGLLIPQFRPMTEKELGGTRMMMKQPFHVGDKVTTEFRKGEAHIVRIVTAIQHTPPPACQSGWRVSTDGGAPCAVCALAGTEIILIDSAWFRNASGK